MTIGFQLVYDEKLTKMYIKRELNNLEVEKENTLAEYNDLIAQFNNYNQAISNVSSIYKIAYSKTLEIGTIGSLPITDTEKLLDSSKSIDELIGAINNIIGQIKELIKKYIDECKVREYKIKNHREYRKVNIVKEK